MSNTRPASSLLGIAAGAAIVVVGFVAWLWSSKSESAVAADRHLAAVTEAAVTDDAPSASPDVVAPDEQEHREPSRSELAEPPAAAPITIRSDSPAAPTREAGGSLLASFVHPDGSQLTVELARVELRDESGIVHSAEVRRSNTVRIRGLVAGKYAASVDAPGYKHREQVLELAQDDWRGDGEPEFDAQLMLWAVGWVAVVVRASDGRDFSELAVDLGHEPMRLFVGAFRVHTRLDPPSDTSAAPSEEPELAFFRPPPGYKSWQLPESCVGSLQVLHPPPFWVGLDVFGTTVGWQVLTADQSEIVFEIDRAALEERLASVLLRVVDPERGSPVERALVTLRADTSAHRRSDQSKVPTGIDGRVELVHVVPGRYELEITRGEAAHQQMIELGPHERRDLGDIALGEALSIEVLVVDENGKPTSAYVEIGPYEKGLRSGEIYPQNLRHKSDSKGRERLPMPSGPAIVRATVEVGRSNGNGSSQEIRGTRSANVLLDPRAAPGGPLRLALASPANVHLSTQRPEGARLEVLDELDVVVARSVRGDEHQLDAELVPGRYRARARDADGTPGFEQPFVVAGEDQRIEIN